MRHWWRVLACAFSLLAVATETLPASAANTWSDTDPILVITTPSGNKVALYVDNGTWGTEHLPSALAAQMTYTVKPNGRGTKATVTSMVPCDPTGSYPTRTIPSTGAFATGTIYGVAYGTCGQPMSVDITLSVP